MKPTSHAFRPKEWIPLINFAVVGEIPKSIVFRDHLLPFEGAKPDPDFLWGLYGTGSMHRALFLVDAYATSQNKQMLTLQLWYHVDNFDLVKSKITRDVADASGFIHTDRLTTVLRKEILDVVLEELKKRTSGNQYEMLTHMSLEEVMYRHPDCVKAIFAANESWNVIVHPVRQLYDSTDEKPIFVATVRAIKSHLKVAQVRYLEHIEVIL